MNRKVKFRGICKEEFHTHHEATEVGEFIYGYLVCPNKIRTAMSEEHGGVGPGIVHVDIEIDPKTVGEYTGLKDKNGREIYEGDIVLLKDEIARGDGQYDDMIGEVVFDTDEACFMFKSFMGTEYLGHAHPDEVIGNIYENKELLKQPA